MDLPAERARRRLPWLLSVSKSDLQHLRKLHALVIRLHLHLTCNFTVGNLISSLAALNLMPYAAQVFDQMPEPNSFVWNSLIRGYLHNGLPDRALSLFNLMRSRAPPDRFTFLNALKSCSGLKTGQSIHTHVMKLGFDLEDQISSSLIEFYFTHGEISLARKVFDEMPIKDRVSRTIAISGYIGNGDMENAMKLFEKMPEKDLVSWSVLITGFVRAGHIVKADELFLSSPNKDLLMYNTMLGGYASSGLISNLLRLLDKMPGRDIVSWNTAISCLLQSRKLRDAMTLFERMILENMFPNEVTLSSLLSGCADLGALSTGRMIHSYIIIHKDDLSLLDSPAVGTSLIDMYSKCGEVGFAWLVFSGMSERDAATWNAMISGFHANGEHHRALEMFHEMKRDDVKINGVTMVVVLSACAHAGLVNEGRERFKSVEREMGIIPEVEHYGCMVDLLGRAGLLHEAHEVIRSTPMEPHDGVWGALLGACHIHGEIELAELAMTRLLDLGVRDGGYMAMMGNIYVAAGRWGDASRVREVMREKGLFKVVGQSSMHHGVKDI